MKIGLKSNKMMKLPIFSTNIGKLTIMILFLASTTTKKRKSSTKQKE